MHIVHLTCIAGITLCILCILCCFTGIMSFMLFCVVFNMILYIKVVKRKNSSLCVFLGMLLLFLIGKYGRLPAE